MFNPNEGIQIVGYSLKEAPTLQDKLLIEEGLTNINKKLELENRYNELQQENKYLKERIEYLERSNDRREQEIIELKNELILQGEE